jgi:hypothetical protein
MVYSVWMTRKITVGAITLSILLLFACGNDSFLFPSHKDSSDFEIRSVADGQVLLPGDSIPLSIAAPDSQKNKDLELQIVLFTASDEKAWETRLTAPVLNEPLPPLQPANLAPGQYRIEITLLSAGDEVQKKTAIIFISGVKLGIAAIKSFPAVITPASSVLLKAELSSAADANPFLRWKWRTQTIASGLMGSGYGEVLWTAPSEEGVYTISVEIFPTVPTDAAATVRSSLSLSTDIYVSVARKSAARELAPDTSYYALYQLQANLRDTGTAVKKTGTTDGTFVGAPRIVPTADGFGYRLSVGDGILIPWLVLPLEGSALAPFTISLGVKLETEADAMRLLSIQAEDASLAFKITMAGTPPSPLLTISTAGFADLQIPSNTQIMKDQRYLLSISVVPREAGVSVQWFRDGEQTNAVLSPLALPTVKGGGNTTIGGPQGFAGTVDGFGVYSRDEKGSPSPDPMIFRRAAQREYKEALVLAEGFDGISVPEGFSMDNGTMDSGFASLPSGAALKLPPLALGTEGIDGDIYIAKASSQAAVLTVSRQGEETPLLVAPVATHSDSLRISLRGNTFSYTGPDGPKSVKLALSAEKETLVFTIQAAPDSQTPLIVDRILLIKEKE